jgi:hypothetical protein
VLAGLLLVAVVEHVGGVVSPLGGVAEFTTPP